jgi:hypothetical protein
MCYARPVRAFHLAAVLTTAVAVFGCSDDDDVSDSAPRSPTSVGTSGTAGSIMAVATTVSASASSGSAPAPTAAGAGFTYTSPDGDFSAVFPSRPRERTQRQQLPDGSVMDLSIAAVETEELFVGTARGQYPKGTVLDVPAALQGAQDQAIANVEGELVASRDLELQGRPGREFSASLTVNGQPSTLLQRVYFDGPVLYQNIVTGAGELTFQDPALAAFFDSFRFTEG